MNFFQRLLQTSDDRTAALLRITLGIVLFPHGAQKALGWFGGYGISATLGFFESMHIPVFFGVLAIIAEFLGSIALIVGFMGRLSAFGIACVMLVAVFTAHIGNGFFMNWAGTAKGEGFEYHILAVGIAIAVMIKGSGALSVDRMLSRKSQA